jgi:hypothetical protein
MSFNGTLMLFDGIEFPMQYIVENSYHIIAKRVQDLDPFTNEAGVTFRNPVEHEPTTIECETRPLNNRELNDMCSFIRSHWNNTKDRNVQITYYIPLFDSYDTGTFYCDVNFDTTIRRIDKKNNTIKYEPITLNFIEY